MFKSNQGSACLHTAHRGSVIHNSRDNDSCQHFMDSQGINRRVMHNPRDNDAFQHSMIEGSNQGLIDGSPIIQGTRISIDTQRWKV